MKGIYNHQDWARKILKFETIKIDSIIVKIIGMRGMRGQKDN